MNEFNLDLFFLEEALDRLMVEEFEAFQLLVGFE